MSEGNNFQLLNINHLYLKQQPYVAQLKFTILGSREVLIVTKEQYQEQQSALVCQDQVNTVVVVWLVFGSRYREDKQQPPPNSHAHKFRLNWAKFIGHFVSKLAQPSNLKCCSDMFPAKRGNMKQEQHFHLASQQLIQRDSISQS